VVGEVVIRRIDRAAAGVADARADDGWMTPEPGVGPPESTQAERRGLRCGGLAVEGELHASPTLPCPGGYAHAARLVARHARAPLSYRSKE
jgi:hypothetical protein